MTLLEVVVAMLLLSVALLGLAVAFPVAMVAIESTGLQATATLLAEQALEAARGTAYASLPALDTGGFADVPGRDDITRSIAVAPGTPTPGTTTVTVTVRARTIADLTLVSVLGP